MLEQLQNLDTSSHNFKNATFAAHTGALQLPFVSSALPIIITTGMYLAFIYKIGPALMKNRAAYNLKNVLLMYNFLQVILNTGLFTYGMFQLIRYRAEVEDWICFASLRSDHMLKPLEVNLTYIYYIIKIVDYSDTIFFVLRKSFKQITLLHVYHHVMMAMSGYFYIHYFGTGGQLVSMAALNTLVHGFMYFYYFITVLRPNLSKSIWWKKYITLMQITQFILVIIHHILPLLLRPNCSVPKILLFFGLLQGIVMLILFSNFYFKTYIVSDRNKYKNSKQTEVKSSEKLE